MLMAGDRSPARVVAVDWSGRVTGAARYRWAAEVADGQLVSLRDGWEIPTLVDHLGAMATDDARLAVGLDFSFSLPGWFLDALGVADGPALWKVVETDGERWLRECAPPFWGRTGRPRPDQVHWRETEATAEAVGGIRPKSSFQVGGAGSVGTGSLRGMPLLTRLRDAGFSIWPFDPPRLPVVVEVWPRQFTGPVVKRRADSRLGLVTERGLPAEAAASEDAFDAVMTALGMWGEREHLATLPTLADPVSRREGRIFSPRLRSAP
jgi:hypothetical protein